MFIKILSWMFCHFHCALCFLLYFWITVVKHLFCDLTFEVDAAKSHAKWCDEILHSHLKQWEPGWKSAAADTKPLFEDIMLSLSGVIWCVFSRLRWVMMRLCSLYVNLALHWILKEGKVCLEWTDYTVCVCVRALTLRHHPLMHMCVCILHVRVNYMYTVKCWINAPA